MAVKIGNSYVTEAAVAYAQSHVDEKSENVLGELSKQFKDVKFGVGTQPFGGTGTNNISIAPNILRQMANDPEKRMEYEALIYDCNNALKNSANRPGLKAQGFVIDGKGELSMWAISQSDDDKSTRSLMHFTDDEKARLAGRLPKKESTTADTDKVDAEIRKLKLKKSQIEQKISSEANPNEDLQRQLAQIENELRRKDNDTYRRANAIFSTPVDIKI
ncbi:MAG: hypothetical protein IKN27_13745 [Selenomonadaceae bacterium]|nr:hypothetical protein [Selenomonadaceae bacterium]